MNYDWQQAGEEWSVNWGGTFNLWHGVLMPRIGSFLGDIRAVEIGPGHGRLTAYLKNYCSSLILVDIAANCIQFCRHRFHNEAHVEFFVNDGSSLSFIPDQTIDLVFSFDSLVHADLEVIMAYLAEIERVLKFGGRAVLHHSNLASLIEEEHGALKGNLHLRDREVSAGRVLARIAELKTLECRTQELISWDDSSRLIDCISMFVRCKEPTQRPLNLILNPHFYERAIELRTMSESYRSDCNTGG